jgi:hypothetical protein
MALLAGIALIIFTLLAQGISKLPIIGSRIPYISWFITNSYYLYIASIFLILFSFFGFMPAVVITIMAALLLAFGVGRI